MAKQDEFVRYTVRLPRELYERIQAAAGNASVNAEVIKRLEAAFAHENETQAALKDHEERIDALERMAIRLQNELGRDIYFAP